MINITTLLDGNRTAIYHIYLLNEGVDNDLVNEPLVVPADMEPSCERLVLEEVSYNFAGFDAKLSFDDGTVAGSLIWVLGEANVGEVDFCRFGGLKDREHFDGTGTLRLTTVGFTQEGDEGSMIIKVRKTSKANLEI